MNFMKIKQTLIVLILFCTMAPLSGFKNKAGDKGVYSLVHVSGTFTERTERHKNAKPIDYIIIYTDWNAKGNYTYVSNVKNGDIKLNGWGEPSDKPDEDTEKTFIQLAKDQNASSFNEYPVNPSSANHGYMALWFSRRTSDNTAKGQRDAIIKSATQQRTKIFYVSM